MEDKLRNMKNKQKTWLIAGIVIIFVIGIALSILRNPEDGWIKGSDGIWVMHGNASSMPDYVKEQYAALNCATDFYKLDRIRSFNFDSQCLGTCGDYAVDVVHVPRTSADDLKENQCNAYLNGSVKHFIEIDKDGKIFRVV